jgi:hypothetical protein
VVKELAEKGTLISLGSPDGETAGWLCYAAKKPESFILGNVVSSLTGLDAFA